MMYNYPFYPFFRRRYPSYYYGYTGYSNNSSKNSTVSNKNNSSKCKEDKKVDNKSDDTLFEIFGLKLHSDDVLLMGLLFFLYNEKVDDQYLFIALILLLLS